MEIYDLESRLPFLLKHNDHWSFVVFTNSNKGEKLKTQKRKVFINELKQLKLKKIQTFFIQSFQCQNKDKNDLL